MGKLVQEKMTGIYTIWEAREFVKELGLKSAMDKIKVVTTGTFEPIEVVSLFFQMQESSPKIKIAKLQLNDVEAYPYGKEGGGILNASVENHAEGKSYSGAHVIEGLVQGKKIRVKAQGQLTERFLRKELDELMDLKKLKSANLELTICRELKGTGVINLSEKTIVSDLGALLPDGGNINYGGCGDISPFSYEKLLKELPVGWPVFIGGAIGEVYENCSNREVKDGEITFRADLKKIESKFLRAGSFGKSGSRLFVGVGVAFEIKAQETLEQLIETNEKLLLDIFDLGGRTENEKVYGRFSFEELSKGTLRFKDKETRTAATASLLIGKEVAEILKGKIEKGDFSICQKHE